MLNKKLNIIIVISHDLGQHMGCYGVPDVRTPNFDDFAAQGLRFENNFCTAPLCSSSRASLWTGCYPHTNGVIALTNRGFQNDELPGPSNERHLAQILADTGYDTHLFGIQHVSYHPERCGFKGIHVRGLPPCGKVAEEVCKFLTDRKDDKNPLFLQAGFFEPHRPFLHQDVETLDPASLTVLPYLPDIPEARQELAELEASCSSADKAFGRIVKVVDGCGMTDNTIVIYTVDHGIDFPHAKATLYDPGIETALLMRIPGVDGGKVYKEMISNVDFAPTILDFLDIEIPENIQGRSFKGLITREGYEPREAIFAEKTYYVYYDPMRAIRTEKWKLIANFEPAYWHELYPHLIINSNYVEIYKALASLHEKRYSPYHPPFELYDLEADPWEGNNLAENSEFKDIRDRLIKQLRQWMQDTGDPLLEGPMAQGAYRNRMSVFKDL